MLMGGLAASADFADLFGDLLGAVIHGHVVDEILNFLLVVGVRECRVDQIFAERLHILVSAHRRWIFSLGSARGRALGYALNGCVLRGSSMGSAPERTALAEILASTSLVDVDAASLLNISPVLFVDYILVSLLLASGVILDATREPTVLDNHWHLLDSLLMYAADGPGLISDLCQRRIRFCHFLRHSDDVGRLSSLVR